MNDNDMYPVMIRKSRYSGAYEQGAWYALLGDSFPEDAECGDYEAMVFWASPEADLIGRGATPNDAYEDLKRRISAYRAKPK